MSPRSHNEPPMHTPLIIGGEKIAQGSESAIETYDPATNEVIATVAQAGTAEVDSGCRVRPTRVRLAGLVRAQAS